MSGRRQRNVSLITQNLATRDGRTSVRLETKLWDAYDDICSAAGLSRFDVSRMIDEKKPDGVSFTSCVRIFVVAYYRTCFRNPAATVSDVLRIAASSVSGENSSASQKPLSVAAAHRIARE